MMTIEALEAYQHFASDLRHWLGDDQCVRVTIPGWPPVFVEVIGPVRAGLLVSLGHLEGDPEMLFLIQERDGMPVAEPVQWRDTGYWWLGGPIPPKGQRVLLAKATALFANLKAKGFLSDGVQREVVESEWQRDCRQLSTKKGV